MGMTDINKEIANAPGELLEVVLKWRQFCNQRNWPEKNRRMFVPSQLLRWGKRSTMKQLRLYGIELVPMERYREQVARVAEGCHWLAPYFLAVLIGVLVTVLVRG